jgi:acid stress chaperone HdeB
MAIDRMGFATVAILLTASAAQAQTTIDVAKITCEQFVLMQVLPPDYLAIWLSGFYNGKRNNTVIEVQQLKDHAEKVKRYCLYNKGTLMEAIEKVVVSGQ